mmetsp:Transcript_884/g.1899  ORF Transcript_884/g.1899 Transcript_884/m.1899 type:complete len:85 (+) Transcript_884:53-307(+)
MCMWVDTRTFSDPFALDGQWADRPSQTDATSFSRTWSLWTDPYLAGASLYLENATAPVAPPGCMLVDKLLLRLAIAFDRTLFAD